MLEYLSKSYPKTTAIFVNGLLYEYGISMDDFEKGSILHRLIGVKQFFGYPMSADKNISQLVIQSEIKCIFTEYENILNKYPGGVPDKLKNFNEMSNAEKVSLHEQTYLPTINISLCHSLIKKNSNIRIVSLKDSIIPNNKSWYAKMEAEVTSQFKKDYEEFWLNTLKINRHETPPF